MKVAAITKAGAIKSPSIPVASDANHNAQTKV